MLLGYRIRPAVDGSPNFTGTQAHFAARPTCSASTTPPAPSPPLRAILGSTSALSRMISLYTVALQEAGAPVSVADIAAASSSASSDRNWRSSRHMGFAGMALVSFRSPFGLTDRLHQVGLRMFANACFSHSAELVDGRDRGFKSLCSNVQPALYFSPISNISRN